jgi:putative transposase
MPSRLERFQQMGELHFLTFSCHDRLPYLATSVVRDLFEHTLEAMRRRYVFFVVGYVAMPEHLYLLLSEAQREILGHAIQALKASVSKQSDRHPFWLARYCDFTAVRL